MNAVDLGREQLRRAAHRPDAREPLFERVEVRPLPSPRRHLHRPPAAELDDFGSPLPFERREPRPRADRAARRGSRRLQESPRGQGALPDLQPPDSAGSASLRRRAGAPPSSRRPRRGAAVSERSPPCRRSGPLRGPGSPRDSSAGRASAPAPRPRRGPPSRRRRRRSEGRCSERARRRRRETASRSCPTRRRRWRDPGAGRRRFGARGRPRRRRPPRRARSPRADAPPLRPSR